ncbi:MAG: Nif3-like dinuclear metal center hexameric protein [Nitrospira bacterium HGW-Nitrospira-1]|nr:MAG: Nif3-like dinuclear metal center hexameric protein [Nitrospira bacterium HGW-Nitrospira-1]
MKGIPLNKLVHFLDAELCLSEFREDESANGLQVEGRTTVRKAGLAVDACEYVFRRAAEKEIDFLLVHHGLIWGGLKALRGVMRKRIKSLFDSEISLYACHLPLDRHPKYGNNARLLQLLSIKKMGEFGEYHGKKIGCWGRTAKELSLDEFTARIDNALQTRSSVVSFGKKVRTVGVVSGGGGFAINEAEKYGIDTFLTGEPSHSAYTLAEEMKVNLVFSGHYATETLGVKAVGEALEKRFGLAVEFIDHPTGL